MNLPPHPLEQADVDAVRNQDDVEQLTPYLRQTGPQSAEARVVFSDTTNGTVAAHYFDPTAGTWTTAGSFDREFEPLALWKDRYVGEVIYRGDDAIQLEALYLDVVKQANRVHSSPVIFGPGVGDPREGLTTAPDSCSHNQRTQRVQTAQNHSMVACAACGRPQTVPLQGTNLPADGLLRASTIEKTGTTDLTTHGAVELLTTTENLGVLGRLAADLLTFMGKLELHYATEFDPDVYEAAFLVIDDDVAGITVWNERDGTTVLRQVYLLPEFRGQGHSVDLLNAWTDAVCDELPYYAEAPNPAGRAMLEAAGHLEQESASGTKATLSYSVSPDVAPEPGRL